MKPALRLLVAAAASAAAVLLAPAPRTSAGCLAPADVLIDVSGTIGPFWGNDTGALLYARGVGAGQELMRKGLGEFAEPIAAAGEQTRFQVGTRVETWNACHGGAMYGKRDCAFVASTTIADDDTTPLDESLPRRGAYALRSNTMWELGRLGGASPVPTDIGGLVPWGTFFDAVPLGRGDSGGLRVVFSAQLGQPDGRQGLFLWEESTGETVPLVLSGDPSPAIDPYATFGRVRCNQAGDVVFYGITQSAPSAPIVPALFRIAAADLHAAPVVEKVVKFGDAGETHAGIGRLSLLQDFDVDDVGNVVFASLVADGAASPSALLRWDGGVVSLVARAGEDTPLGGVYGAFTQAQVRSDEGGTATFMVPVTGAVKGVGFFSAARGSTEILPLAVAEEPLALASTGAGRVAYQTPKETRTIVPNDGSDEGPKDYRVARLDLRNSAAIAKDALQLDIRFRLPPWGTGAGQLPPAVLLADAERTAADRRLTAPDLARIGEVNLQVSQSPGQAFVFGIGGTPQKPTGYVTVNGASGFVTKFVLSKTRDSATWGYKHTAGTGTFTIDLAKGSAKLRIAKGNFQPSFEAPQFPVEMTLRTDADVAANRTRTAAYWFRAVRLDGDQPNFPNGRRVVSNGERLRGGTFFVDALRVDRKLKVVKGQAAPNVQSDTVRLSGTLRLAPGSTSPTTPVLTADVTIGDLVLTDLPLKRVGRTGSKYTGKTKVAGVSTTLTFDVGRASFSFSATNVPPLSQLTNADFSAGAVVNGPKKPVGGMSLPVTISIARVYESVSDFAITRLPGGKTFVR